MEIAEDLFRHDMKRIIAETERDAFAQIPPNDGSSIAKWTPRTPPRSEWMPPTPGLPPSSSQDKRVDVRTSPGMTQGSSNIVRLDTASSGLLITRPRGVIPVIGIGKPQSQSPPKAITSKPRVHAPPLPTRTQSTQVSQPITPIKMGASSSSIRRTSWVFHPHLSLRETEIGCFRSGGKLWADTSSNSPSNEQSSQSRVTSFAAIQSLQEEEKLPKGKQKQSLKEIQEEEEARAAEEDFLKWWAAEEERVRKEEEEALKAALSMAEGGSGGGGVGKRQRGRGGGNRKSSRGKQHPEHRHSPAD